MSDHVYTQARTNGLYRFSVTDGRGGTVAGIHNSLVGQRIQFFPDGTTSWSKSAAGQIGTTDGTLKQRVAGKDDAVQHKRHTTRRMSRRVPRLRCQIRPASTAVRPAAARRPAVRQWACRRPPTCSGPDWSAIPGPSSECKWALRSTPSFSPARRYGPGGHGSTKWPSLDTVRSIGQFLLRRSPDR